jgi:hypothetical protein
MSRLTPQPYGPNEPGNFLVFQDLWINSAQAAEGAPVNNSNRVAVH